MSFSSSALRNSALRASASVALLALGACGAETPGPVPEPELKVIKDVPLDVPVSPATDAQKEAFALGDAAFGQTFRAADGLGPLFIQNSCEACHAGAGRGPTAVEKVTLVGEDGTTPSSHLSAELPWGQTVRKGALPGIRPLLEPTSTPPQGETFKTSLRLGPAVFARGWMEAVKESEIERLEREQAARGDGIHGRVHRVAFQSEFSADPTYHQHVKGEPGLIGRFGLKARIATLDDFAADAFQGDMGITSPLRPNELPNPDDARDDQKPGIDTDLETVRHAAEYMRLLAVPPRPAATEQTTRGAALFEQVKCGVCHTASLETRADYPVPQIAGKRAALFTDFLLHDMGALLADGVRDFDASGREWKTPPLVGVSLQRTFLHDGRAKTVEAAVLAHAAPGSQGAESATAYQALSDGDREALVAFVKSL